MILGTLQVGGVADRFPDKGDKKHFERMLTPVLSKPGAQLLDKVIPDIGK